MNTPRPPVNEVPKTWGREVWVVNNDRYCGKILYFNAGKHGSLHYHKNKHETFFLRVGSVVVEINGVRYGMSPGEAVDVPADTPHRVKALEASELWEFSTPHDDDDTYRIEPSSS